MLQTDGALLWLGSAGNSLYYQYKRLTTILEKIWFYDRKSKACEHKNFGGVKLTMAPKVQFCKTHPISKLKLLTNCSHVDYQAAERDQGPKTDPQTGYQLTGRGCRAKQQLALAEKKGQELGTGKQDTISQQEG